MQDATKHYINGAWVASIDGNEMAVENPSSKEQIATISLGGPADADAAVAAAKVAFPAWAATEPQERIAALERLMEAYKARAGEVAQAISNEMGAPIALAQTAQVGAGAGHLKNTIRAARGFAFERPLGDHAPGDMILYEPVGVCALITPWNWPMNQVMLKVAPALAAGCTVVLKPSELAPLSAMLLAEMIGEAGFPPGVFNLVNGDGADVGAHLTAHPDVDMISFTGSTRAGIAISKSAADTVKRVSLELGGKGANIVFADAGEKAVTRGVRHCFNNSGQSCNAPTLIAGGPGRPDGLNRGHFVRPTVFADVTPGMTIWREEIFGPILSITPFDTEEEAIALANDTPYGLTNYVQTADKVRVRQGWRGNCVPVWSK